MAKFWSAEEGTAVLDRLAQMKGVSLNSACFNILPWNNRSADSIRRFVERLCRTYGVAYTIENIPVLKQAWAGNAPEQVIQLVTDAPEELNTLEDQVLSLIKTKGVLTTEDISRAVDRSKDTVKKTLDALDQRGYAIKYEDDTKQVTLAKDEHERSTPLDLSKLRGGVVKFGLLSDTHLGSKYECLGGLESAYLTFQQERCDFVIHCGDLLDGIKMYRGHESELHKFGADDQIKYAVDNYPYIKNLRTFIISGNHDLSFRKEAGLVTTRVIAKERDDFEYRGDIAADFTFYDRYQYRIFHPNGGLSYARSYKAQKAVEAVIADAVDAYNKSQQAFSWDILPIGLGIGHYHVAGWFPLGGVQTWMVPCFQRQTPYLMAKALNPQIGFYVVSMEFAKDKTLLRLHHEYFPLEHRLSEIDKERL